MSNRSITRTTRGLDVFLAATFKTETGEIINSKFYLTQHISTCGSSSLQGHCSHIWLMALVGTLPIQGGS